jgi:TIR domain
MYNLFVTADCDAWDGTPTKFDLSRCLREYTDDVLEAKYAQLSDTSIADLVLFPCLFACESGCDRPAKVGHLTQVTRRGTWVRIEYIIDANYPEIPRSDLSRLEWDLDIDDWEMNRTHWALKDVDLHTVLSHANISGILQKDSGDPIDVTSATFDVALSFPGESRSYSRAVAERLSLLLGRRRVFFDEYYKSQLARPNLDTLLQDIYRNRSRLIVAFLSAAYQTKDWCGIEFKAIRDILKQRDDSKVMYVRHDAGHVDGVFSTDGYIDANIHKPIEVADLIVERVRLKPRNEEA